MKPATPAAQARVLRRLFLTLVLRGRRKAQGRPSRLGPWLSFALMLSVFSLFGLISLGAPRGDLFIFAGSLHALAFLLVGMHLAVSTGQLLFNPEEAEVLLHRPILPRALLQAKVQTLAFFSLALATATSACGLIVGITGTSAAWMFLPAHLLSLAVEILFGVSVIVLAYNLSLQWFGRERLENLMTGLQVVVAIGFMLIAQIVPRLLTHLDFSHARLPGWLNVFPPVWFAALDVLLTGGPATRGLLLPAALGLLITAATVWLGVVRLAAAYQLGLEALNETGSAAVRPGGHGGAIERLRRWPVLRRWLRDPVEAAAFRLTLAYLARGRDVKLRVYPMLAQLLVYPVFILFGGVNQGSVFSMQPYLVAYIGYFLAMLPTLVLDRLRVSEDFEAAAIFRQAPLARPSALFHGARKGVIVALCLPGLLVVVAAGSIWLRDKSQLLLLLPGLLALPPFSLLASLASLFIPFSDPVEGGSRGLRTMGLILLFQLGSFALSGLAGWCWSSHYFSKLLLTEAAGALLLTWGLQAIIRARRFPRED